MSEQFKDTDLKQDLPVEFLEYIERLRVIEALLLNTSLSDYTDELCLDSLKLSRTFIHSINAEYLDSSLELWKKIVTLNGSFLRDMPQHFFCAEIIELALQSNAAAALQVLNLRVPELITYDYCKTAVQQTGRALRYVPDEYRTDEIYLWGVCSDGEGLDEDFPRHLLSKKLCQFVISKNSYAIADVPYKYLNYHICYTAAERQGDMVPFIMNYIPKKYLRKELIRMLLSKSMNTIASTNFPARLRNYEFFKLARPELTRLQFKELLAWSDHINSSAKNK